MKKKLGQQNINFSSHFSLFSTFMRIYSIKAKIKNKRTGMECKIHSNVVNLHQSQNGNQTAIRTFCSMMQHILNAGKKTAYYTNTPN